MVHNLPSFQARPGCILSRPNGLHAWAPCMGTILKLPLSLLALRNEEEEKSILLKSAHCSLIELPVRPNASFLGSSPWSVEAGEAWGFHNLILEYVSLVLPKSLEWNKVWQKKDDPILNLLLAHIIVGPLSTGAALIVQYLRKCKRWSFEL